VKKTLYATPQDAETAFYEAFVRRDLEAMMEVWSEDEDIYCIHPGSARISGHDKIRESWRQIFGSGQDLRFNLRETQRIHTMMLAVHSVYELIGVAGQPRARQVIIATNAYQRTDRGWRMIVHHAAAAPAALKAEPGSDLRPKTLH
jgi:ketosteroid isomerase-like protein